METKQRNRFIYFLPPSFHLNGIHEILASLTFRPSIVQLLVEEWRKKWLCSLKTPSSRVRWARSWASCTSRRCPFGVAHEPSRFVTLLQRETGCWRGASSRSWSATWPRSWSCTAGCWHSWTSATKRAAPSSASAASSSPPSSRWRPPTATTAPTTPKPSASSNGTSWCPLSHFCFFLLFSMGPKEKD